MNELEIPCVVATTSAKELAFDNVSSVCVDDEAATMELVQYLTGYGHKDIVVMGGEISDKQISFSRYLGCKKGFEKVAWNLIRIRIIWLAGIRMRQVMRQQKDYLKKTYM